MDWRMKLCGEEILDLLSARDLVQNLSHSSSDQDSEVKNGDEGWMVEL